MVEGTTVTVEVGGEPFVAKGDVLVVPGFRRIYPYGLKKDEQLPALHERDEVDFLGAEQAQKATEPPARYSQGKLIQEMEKRGLGTKATRHAIIERLLEVKYVVDEPPRPTNLGRAVIDALSTYAQRITTPDMTSELEAEMDAIAAGGRTRTEVVAHSRELLARAMDDLLPKAAEVGEMLKVAGAGDAKVGVCPKSGHDLLVKSSAKTRGQFVGCSGWPDCDVTYPLPQGKIEAVPEPCPECGTPQVKVIQFRSKPRVVCLDPACATNHEPEVNVGVCSGLRQGGQARRPDRAPLAAHAQALRALHQLRRVPDELPAAAARRPGGDGRDLRDVRRPDGHRDDEPRPLEGLHRSGVSGAAAAHERQREGRRQAQGHDQGEGQPGQAGGQAQGHDQGEGQAQGGQAAKAKPKVKADSEGRA